MKLDRTLQGSVLTENLFNHIANALLLSAVSLPGGILAYATLDQDLKIYPPDQFLCSMVLSSSIKVSDKHVYVLGGGGGDPPEPSWLQRFPR